MKPLPFKTFTGNERPYKRWWSYCHFVIKTPPDWDKESAVGARNRPSYLPVYVTDYSGMEGVIQGWSLSYNGVLKEISVEPRQLLVPLFRDCTGIVDGAVYYMSRSGTVEYGRGIPTAQLHIQILADNVRFRNVIKEPGIVLALLGQAMKKQTPVISEGKPCVIGAALALVPLGNNFTIWWRDTVIGDMYPGSDGDEVVMRTGFEKLKGKVLKCIRRARRTTE